MYGGRSRVLGIGIGASGARAVFSKSGTSPISKWLKRLENELRPLGSQERFLREGTPTNHDSCPRTLQGVIIFLLLSCSLASPDG